MLEILRKILGGIWSGKTSAATNSSTRRAELESLKLQDSQALPDLDQPFNLVWSIRRDEELEDILLYEFTTDGGTLLTRELAHFEDSYRAKNLVSLLRAKYGNQMREIYLAPGVGIYIGGCNTSGWESFIDFVCSHGYERVHSDIEFAKRDGATREILVPETIFKLRQ